VIGHTRCRKHPYSSLTDNAGDNFGLVVRQSSDLRSGREFFIEHKEMAEKWGAGWRRSRVEGGQLGFGPGSVRGGRTNARPE